MPAESHSLDQNLLTSARKPKAGPGAPKGGLGSQLDPHSKKILKIGAYTAIFLFFLSLFTVLKIPDSVVANVTLNALNQQTPYQWQADKIGLGFFLTPHVYFEKLSLEPKMPGGTSLAFDELKIYPGLFSLLPIGGPPAFSGSFKATAYSARFTGYASAASTAAFELETEGADLAKLTPLSEAGVDVKGTLKSLLLQLKLPNQRLSAGDGKIQLMGKNVILDPGPLGLPMALPILNLGEVDVRGTLTRGQLKIEKFQVGGAKGDLEVQASGTVTLSDVVQFSRVELHLKVKPSANIEKAVPSLPGLLDALGTKKPDGFYAFKLSGTLTQMNPPQKD